MNFLIISQVFWPDTASTAQHLFDLSEQLIQEGHYVTVYCSRHAYENNQIRFSKQENYRGIQIKRINNTRFGKKNTVGRLIDFGSFNLLLFFRLIALRKRSFDAMIGMTSPPLISFFGLYWARRKAIKFFYWVMDLQPELAIASGIMKKNSLLARLTERIGNYIIRNADSVIVLDKYMYDYMSKRGRVKGHVHIVPVWPVVETPYQGIRSENPFRLENKFGERIVIMYSGNHSHIHPLNTLLQGILKLKNDPDFIFVFVGDGVRKKDVTNFIKQHDLSNVVQLPYQPRQNIHNSLAASDIQVVIMGEELVGYTHPNKIYGAMYIGKPVLYIGPDPSHITEILKDLEGNIMVLHDQVEDLVEKLLAFKSFKQEKMDIIGGQNKIVAERNFNPRELKSTMVDILTSPNS
jgi:glycosyltransferase involved in cell wall biosynthesis